ncbi:MAG: trigger factor, partial [Spirochaetes bacterium]|nr:trigger factor [Spirochaetota bacterium]
MENSRMELAIDVPEDQVELEYKHVFSKLQREAKIKGFRKGKVPLDIVTQRFKEAADQDVAENLLKAKYIDAVNEKGLSPISMPEFELDKIERGKPLSFKVRFDIAPTVEIGKYKGLDVNETDSKIEDADIENEIQVLRERHASISKKEEDKPAEKGDFVRVQIKRIDNIEASEIEKMQSNEVPIILGKSTQEYDLDENVIGMKLNEEKEIIIKYPKDYYVKDIAGQKVKYLAKMHEINKMTLPELDDEFAKDLGEYTSLSELRNKIKENLENFIKEKAKSRAKFEILDKIIEDSKFDLPESIIKAEMKSVFKRFQYSAGLPDVTDIDELMSRLEGSNKEFYENIRKQAEKNIKSNLALSEIAKKENLKVSEETYRKTLEDIAKRNNQSFEEIEKIANEGNVRENLESELILSDSF